MHLEEYTAYLVVFARPYRPNTGDLVEVTRVATRHKLPQSRSGRMIVVPDSVRMSLSVSLEIARYDLTLY